MTTTHIRTSKLAIFSLILGIVSFCAGFLAGIPAVVCGHLGLSRIGKSNGTQSGKGLAIAGLVTGYLGIVIGTVILIASALPIYSLVVENAHISKGKAKVMLVHSALIEYANQNDGTTPDSLQVLVDAGKLTAEHISWTHRDGTPVSVRLLTPSTKLNDLQPSDPVLTTDGPIKEFGPVVVVHLDGSTHLEEQ